MCGRYAQSQNVHDLVAEFEAEQGPADALEPDYNVAPTKEVYAVVERAPRERPEAAPVRQLRVMRWGLVPSWAKDPSIGSRMINARSETVAEKPAFKRAFARRRCLLPADGYYEWWTPPDGPRGKSGKPLKQPFFIRPRDGETLAMAGLYEFWRDRTREDDDPLAWWSTVTVLTTAAEDAVGRIHDRMPLAVPRERWQEWLDPGRDGAEDPAALTSLLVPAAPGLLAAYPVSTAVNNVRNNGPELIAELPAADALAGAEAMLF
jgi:putative SOS response-associated peptidase YedK